MNSPASSRGQGGPLRSRRGCVHCRRRKVKCDEQHPSCGRCKRLKQGCEWLGPEEQQTLSEKRRRARERTTPKSILPNVPPIQSVEKASSQASSSFVGFSMLGDEGFINPPITGVEEWLGLQDSIGDLNAQMGDPQEFNPFETSMSQDLSSLLGDTFWSEFSPSIPSSLRNIWDFSKPSLGLASPLDMMAPSFPGQWIALSPEFKFTRNEQRALHHYQHFYLSSQATKRNAAWSTLGAILSLGASIPMVMHLLIATSLIYLAACYEYDPQISYVAQQHFKAGAQLLIKTLTDGSEPDHASILVAFHFTYCYMIKRKDIDPVALSQLSKAVLRHVERYGLDSYCAGKLAPEQGNSSAIGLRGLSNNNRSFLARMIMWLYYEDAIGCSMGHGGALASHLTAHGGRMREIYQTSTTALESFWGEEYPVEEVVDDVENEAALEFLHEVWTCFQCLDQCYTHAEVNTTEKDEVDQKIATLEQKSHSLFRLSNLTTTPRTQLLQNADFALAYYHALLIFRHRHELSLNRSLAPLPPSTALTPLLSIIQRTFATEHSGRDRYMWPLFLAGIDTEDPIHHEWIMGKMEDRRMSGALQQIWDVQRRMGRRLEMRVVKKLLNGKELTLMPVA